MPARFCDTVFVFYCQRGMSKVEELLSSQVSIEWLCYLNSDLID